MRNNIEHVNVRLDTLFPGQIRDMHPCWDECAWSRVYRVVLLDSTCMFLKGTPRSRNEALLTQRLHMICPTVIPKVIVLDLVPEADWQWFLLEDAGYCNHDALSPTTAREAAYLLGYLQRYAVGDNILPSLVVHCEGIYLQERVQDVCAWATEHAQSVARENIQHIALAITRASPFFCEVADQLRDVPETIVHGDLWAGNIAVTQGEKAIRLVDWGDALRGVGGVSIVHLLLTAQGTLDKASSTIWDAYGSGLGMHINPAYRTACVIANLVIGLITDMEIARCCGRGLENLPGLLPQLRSLEAQVLGHSSLL